MKGLRTITLGVGMFLNFTSASLSLAAPVLEAELVVRHRIHSSHPFVVKVKIHRLKPGVFECGTDATPFHRMRVAGFSELQAPFSSEAISLTCDDEVSWLEPVKKDPSGTACYIKGQFPVVDEIFRSCLNL